MPISKQEGFTLIELVTVIVLLGIVSVAVVTRFSGNDGFADYALRDELIASYRYAQHWATFDHSGDCYSLEINSAGFEPQQNGSTFGKYGQVSFSGDYAGLSVDTAELYFDGLGNVRQSSCGGATLSSPLTLNVGNTSVTVFSTGFIKAN